jgi:hypothetical protein
MSLDVLPAQPPDVEPGFEATVFDSEPVTEADQSADRSSPQLRYAEPVSRQAPDLGRRASRLCASGNFGDEHYRLRLA